MSLEQPSHSLRQPLIESASAQPSSVKDRSILASVVARTNAETGGPDGIENRILSSAERGEPCGKIDDAASEEGEGSPSRQSTGGDSETDSDFSLAAAEDRLAKLLPEGSRMSIKVTGNTIIIRIPPTDDLLSALDLWSHKKLVLAWGLFFFLLLRFTWSMHHGIYPGYEPFKFGAVLLVFTVFRFSLKLTVSGALAEEEIQLQHQTMIVNRKSCCRSKTASADKCEILSVDTTKSGILIKCAGVGMFGLPKRFLVGRCVSLPERETLAAFLRGYVSSGAPSAV